MTLLTFLCVLICGLCPLDPVVAYLLKNPVVFTKYGPIVGTTQLSRYAREYASFRGIPYAKPPIGELRFKAPEPPEPWTFAVNATKDRAYCIQKNYFFANPKVEGSEDCLYLNVYVPKTDDNQLLPVMVFIHWGGFFAGRGTSDVIGPEYLMDRDVVLVTFNYRLGVFGFFSTLDDSAPGNFGLKDQSLALRFVQENIESFGGDKNKVTLFGQSAGGGSTSLHLLSPLSRGLFQQAISQSGASLNVWARPLNSLQPDVIAALAVITGCSQFLGNNSGLVTCLRGIEATKLAETSDKFKYFQVEPLTPYSIVSEVQTEANLNPFLTKDPIEYIENGEFMKVPWIVGNVQDEGILRASSLLRQPETLQTLNANFTTLLPQMLFLQFSVGSNSTSLLEAIVEFYLGGNSYIDVNDPKSVQGFIDLYSDRAFLYGIYQTIFLHSRNGHHPIWVYNFNYRGEYTYGDPFAATANDIQFKWGVSHCDDLLYLFRTPALFPDLQKPADLQMSEELLNFWTNFAIFGDPDPLQSVGWRSLCFLNESDARNENVNVLQISGSYDNNTIEFATRNGFFPDRVRFWADQKLTENFVGLT